MLWPLDKSAPVECDEATHERGEYVSLRKKVVAAITCGVATIVLSSPAGASPECVAAGLNIATGWATRCMQRWDPFGPTSGYECATDGAFVGALGEWYCEIMSPP